MRYRAALVIVLACSSGTRSVPPVVAADPRPPSDAVSMAAPAPTEQECAELINHVVALVVAGQRAAKPPDQVATEADQNKIRTELQTELAAECRTLTRATYDCAMAAKSTAAFAACQRSSEPGSSKPE